MKISVSLPDRDVATLDEYARRRGIEGRSAALRAAVALLREADLVEEYKAAIEEWERSPDAALWAAIETEGM